MKIRLLAFVLVLGLAAIAIGWVYESRLAPEEAPAATEIPDNIDFYLAEMRMRSIDRDGALDFELDSPRVEHLQRGDVSRIVQPRLRIHREPGNWTVEARRGRFEHRDNLLRLQREVIMRRAGDRPLELRTERIRFEPDRDLVATESSVSMLDGKDGDIYRLTAARAVYRQ